MILALLACAISDSASPEDTAAAPPLLAEPSPVAGTFAMTLAEEWEGDCQFDDPATYEAAEQEWTFDPRDDVLIVYQGFWDLLACSLDGMDFVCDNGSWEASRMEVTLLLEGTFPSDDTVEGAFVVELDCGGAGCDTLKDTYGRRLDFPCRAEAPFAGVME